jgi:hypothetical protein
MGWDGYSASFHTKVSTLGSEPNYALSLDVGTAANNAMILRKVPAAMW